MSKTVNHSATIRALGRAVSDVRDRIAAACQRAGRGPEEVRLIAVTKGVEADAVAAAVHAGMEEFGENYVQELEAKRSAAPDPTWHFIGRMQRNKAHRVLEYAHVIHTLEPGSALERLQRLAVERERPADGLVEVDFTRGRVGVPPDEAEGFVERLIAQPGIRVLGLMTMAPLGEDPRPWFGRLRELRDRLRGRHPEVTELSMGMSVDLEAAVEEGATMVRVGTAIFGARPPRATRSKSGASSGHAEPPRRER